MTTTEPLTELPVYAPESLRKLLNGGIPVEDMFTVYSCIKPRGTVSILDGTIKGIEPFLNSVYLRNIPVSVNLES